MPLNLMQSSVFGIKNDQAPMKERNLSQKVLSSVASPDGQMHDRSSERNGVGLLFKQEPAHVLRLKPSNVMNKPHQHTLRSHSSKLHLIDNTTLTSLPFAPPAASKRLKRGSSTSLRFTHRTSSNSAKFIHSSPNSSRLTHEDSFFAESANISGYETGIDSSVYLHEDDTTEEIADDSVDPIVLVEDYVTEAQSEETILRKKSLANIKKRLREEGSGTSHASLYELPQSSLNFFRGHSCRVSSEINEDLEAIFGKLPGVEKLKHCTLCDKPLYELSSVLSNSDIDHVIKKNSKQHFQEFVCWDCRFSYDKIHNELHEAELSNSNESLCSLPGGQRRSEPNDGSSRYCEADQSKQFEKKASRKMQASKRRNFSGELIKRFQYLSELSKPKTENSEWLANLQEKLAKNLGNLFPSSHAQVEQP